MGGKRWTRVLLAVAAPHARIKVSGKGGHLPRKLLRHMGTTYCDNKRNQRAAPRLSELTTEKTPVAATCT